MKVSRYLLPINHGRRLLIAVGLILSACTSSASLEDGNIVPLSENADSRNQNGGSHSQKFGSRNENESVQIKNPAAATKVEQIFAANSFSNSVDNGNDDYRIAPLDVIEISVFGVPDMTRTVQVNSSGTVNLPLIREVQAGGRTSAELERDIAAKLDRKYLQHPEVSVYVKEFNSQRITVDGAVKSPGIFPITGKTSLLQMIALAGGLDPVADPAGILVFRTVEGKRMAARFDLRQIRSGKHNDPVLQAGDIVMVDQSAARTTLRDVKDVMPLSGLFSLLMF